MFRGDCEPVCELLQLTVKDSPFGSSDLRWRGDCRVYPAILELVSAGADREIVPSNITQIGDGVTSRLSSLDLDSSPN